MLRGHDNRGTEVAEIETPKSSRGRVADYEVWGSVVGLSSPSVVRGGAPAENEFWNIYFRASKTHMIAANLSFLTFLRHIFSHIHIHKY